MVLKPERMTDRDLLIHTFTRLTDLDNRLLGENGWLPGIERKVDALNNVDKKIIPRLVKLETRTNLMWKVFVGAVVVAGSGGGIWGALQ